MGDLDFHLRLQKKSWRAVDEEEFGGFLIHRGSPGFRQPGYGRADCRRITFGR